MESKEAEDDPNLDADRSAGHSPTSEEISAAVTPEMVEAGRLALASSDRENKPLEHSIGEIYVAMAAEDHAAVSKQKNIAQAKNERRINKRLYFGALVMFIIAIALLMMKIIPRF